jgi:acyl-CoA synthetase (AMP-forming)/AMP-acid ligase II
MRESDISIDTYLQKLPQQEFICLARRTITRSEARAKVGQLKNSLLQMGLGSGDTVALYADVSFMSVCWLLAVLDSGMQLLCLHLRESQDVIASRLKENNCQHLISAATDWKNLPRELEIISIDDSSKEGVELTDICIKPPITNNIIEPVAGMLLIYTSGSSATPKLIRISLVALLRNAISAVDCLEFTVGDRWLLNLPLYHVGGIAPIFRSLCSGGSIAIGSEKDFPVLSHVSIVLTQLNRILEDKQCIRYYQSLKIVLHGGGPLPFSLSKKAIKAGLPLRSSYGLSESASLICVSSGVGCIHENSVGRPTGACQIMISDSDEVLIRGSALFDGYSQIDGSFNYLFTSNNTGDDWFATGDKGYFTDSGELCITGRIDRQFISGGENIQPEEIEIVLLACPQIARVVIVDIKNVEYGRRPVCFLEPQVGVEFGDSFLDTVKEFLKPRLANFKHPDQYYEWPQEQKSPGQIKIRYKRFAKLAEDLSYSEK